MTSPEHLRRDLTLIAAAIREERRTRTRTTLASRLRGGLPLDIASEIREDQDNPSYITIFNPLDPARLKQDDRRDRINRINKTCKHLDALGYRYDINDDGTISLLNL